MLDLADKEEGVSILAKVEEMCKLLDSGCDVFDIGYGISTEEKMCFWKSHATSEVTHFKELDAYREWMHVRNGVTEESFEKIRSANSAVDPGKEVYRLNSIKYN